MHGTGGRTMGRMIDADKLIRRMRTDMDRMKYQYNLDVICLLYTSDAADE